MNFNLYSERDLEIAEQEGYQRGHRWGFFRGVVAMVVGQILLDAIVRPLIGW